MTHEKILIIDNGEKHVQIIASMVRSLGVYSEVVRPININLDGVIGIIGKNESGLPTLEIKSLNDGTKDEIEKFLKEECIASFDWKIEDVIEEMTEEIRREVGDGKVLLALSGGVDSSVLSLLLEKAIGSRLTCVFVDTGLMRKHEGDEVEAFFKGRALSFLRINAEDEYLERLKGITDPEEKRKIIGELFIRIFEREAKNVGKVGYLAQGTIYPDIIESHSENLVKSHHNVGGLPDVIDFKGIIEPFKYLFKGEVREIGRSLGLAPEILNRQPFPGPGLSVRVIGEITKEKLEILRDADYIFRSEIERENISSSQYFAVLMNTKSVGVRDEKRTYGYTLALRAIKTQDFMSAGVVEIPYSTLSKIVEKITQEVPDISRIVLDITPKPPSTIEWE